MIAAFVVPQEPEKKPKYIECEAAYPLAKKICDAIDSEDFQRLNFGMRILDWIDDIPAADVQPVVTCDVCVWHVDDGNHYCKKWRKLCPDNADFFCAYGERPNCGARMGETE